MDPQEKVGFFVNEDQREEWLHQILKNRNPFHVLIIKHLTRKVGKRRN